MANEFQILTDRINKLKKQLGYKQVKYSDGPLTGAVTCCNILGVDKTTGDLYYKDVDGNWAAIPSGGAFPFTGWDDMLAQNQAQTADREIDLDENDLTFKNNANFYINGTSGSTILAANGNHEFYSYSGAGDSKLYSGANGEFIIASTDGLGSSLDRININAGYSGADLFFPNTGNFIIDNPYHDQKVGIGTSSPAASLDVLGNINSNSSGIDFIGEDNLGRWGYHYFGTTSGGSVGDEIGVMVDKVNNLYSIGDFNSQYDGNRLSINGNNGQTVLGNNTNDLKFGINTSTPTEALDVVGNIKTSSGVILPTYTGIDLSGGDYTATTAGYYEIMTGHLTNNFILPDAISLNGQEITVVNASGIAANVTGGAFVIVVPPTSVVVYKAVGGSWYGK